MLLGPEKTLDSESFRERDTLGEPGTAGDWAEIEPVRIITASITA